MDRLRLDFIGSASFCYIYSLNQLIMYFPKRREVYLMDDLLIYEYQTEGENTPTVFIKKHHITSNEYSKIYGLVKYFGNEAEIISISGDGFLVEKSKAEQFIVNDGFENYFEAESVEY
jgi:hypothetical protein